MQCRISERVSPPAPWIKGAEHAHITDLHPFENEPLTNHSETACLLTPSILKGNGHPSNDSVPTSPEGDKKPEM
ncbi:UNVERIFIED_CONTAM: hypothetical protein K2H54_059876 [Gekko kuhli]